MAVRASIQGGHDPHPTEVQHCPRPNNGRRRDGHPQQVVGPRDHDRHQHDGNCQSTPPDDIPNGPDLPQDGHPHQDLEGEQHERRMFDSDK